MPTSITDLTQVQLPLLSSDAIIVSRSGQYYKTTIQSIWNISTALFSILTPLLPTDQFLVWRDGLQYIVSMDQIAFEQGTAMWFYSASAPSGWQIVSLAGDSLLGVVSASGQFLSGGTQLYNSAAAEGTGTWNISADQLTPHTHPIEIFASNGATGYIGPSDFGPNYNQQIVKNVAPNWGDWRPVTAIGVIAAKL